MGLSTRTTAWGRVSLPPSLPGRNWQGDAEHVTARNLMIRIDNRTISRLTPDTEVQTVSSGPLGNDKRARSTDFSAPRPPSALANRTRKPSPRPTAAGSGATPSDWRQGHTADLRCTLVLARLTPTPDTSSRCGGARCTERGQGGTLSEHEMSESPSDKNDYGGT